MRSLRNKFLLSILWTFAIYSFASGQMNDARIRGLVLNKGIKDSLFIFNFSKPNNHNETQLKYLGLITTTSGGVYKIMTYCWIWGPSGRATNRILIYNSKNQYVGNYKLTMKNELPEKVIGNLLIFNTREDPNSEPVETRISFGKGLPKNIYIKNGGEYTFYGD